MKKVLLLCFVVLLSSVAFSQAGYGTSAYGGDTVGNHGPQKEAKAKAGLKATVTAHSVTLTCTPPTSGTVPTGYYFYRGSTPGGEGTTAISPLQSTCGYVDTTVAALQTYYYTAKSFSSTSTAPGLSGPSNEVMTVIPGDPAPLPPANVTATPQ